MKIQKLKITNIASIDSAEIDFSAGPLATDSIFLITGDTGTGKSTILNAICLALYDEVPALKTVNTQEKDHDGLQIGNTRQLIRKGAAFAQVELTFVGNDDVPYMARWTTQRARRKANGKLQNTVIELINLKTGMPTVGKKDVKQVVHEVVGLTFEQFMRTTMLAQGQFAAFMKAKDDDKSDILEKLTGTEIYTRIGKNIYDLYRAKEQECDLLDATIKGSKPLSDEVKADYQSQIASLNGQVSRLDARFATVDRQLSWLTHENDLRRQLADRSQAKLAAAAVVEGDEYRQHSMAVADWDATTDIRALMSARTATQKRISGFEIQLQALSRHRFDAIMGGVAYLRKKYIESKETLDATAAKIDRLSPMKATYDNSQRIEAISKNVAGAMRDKLKHNTESERLKSEAEMSLKAETPLAGTLKCATDTFMDRQRHLHECELMAEKFDIDRLTTELNGTVKSITALNDAIARVRDYNKCVADHDVAQSDIKAANEAKDITVKDLDATNKALPKAKEDYLRSESFLQGQMQIKDHIDELRSRFADTHVCPVCGTSGVSLYADDAIDRHLAAAKDAYDNAKQHLDTLNHRLSTLNATLAVQTKQIGTCTDTLKSRAAALSRAEAKAKAATADYKSSVCIASMEAQVKVTEQKRAELSGRMTAANTALAALGKARKDLDLARKQMDSAQIAYDRQKQLTQQRTDAAEREALAAIESAKAAESALGEMSAAMDAASASQLNLDNAMVMAKKIKEGAAEYNALIIRRDSLDKEVDALGNKLRSSTDRMAPVAKRFAEQYGVSADIEPVECCNIDVEINGLLGEINRLDGALDTERANLDVTDRAIDDYFGESDLSVEVVEAIAAIGADTIVRYRKSVNDALQAYNKATNELGVIEQQIADHAVKRPELADDDTVESLTQVKDATETERREATAIRVSLETLLKTDAANALAQADNIAKLQRLRDQCNQWAKLNDIFGGSDGKLFKRIAQSYVLRALLVKANYYLGMLSRRYRLDCDDGSLTINVIDSMQRDAVRNVGLLSGGEGFVVSLSLALGLSAISKDRISVDTLFIDEGFGTLDKDILETVINTLDRLHSIGGRRIGIISHVQELKHRIPTQIRLVPSGPGTWTISTVAL